MRDRAEFTAYVEARSPKLLRTAYLLCRDWAQAEDLLQTALVKVWRAWRRIGDDPDPYVYRILVNTHASWWRRRWRGEIPTSAPPETTDVSDAMGAADSRAQPGGRGTAADPPGQPVAGGRRRGRGDRRAGGRRASRPGHRGRTG
jgi:DNA-directed RNA polymerase specialized sigma24 family protein